MRGDLTPFCDSVHPDDADITCFKDIGHDSAHEGSIYVEDEYKGTRTW